MWGGGAHIWNMGNSRRVWFGDIPSMSEEGVPTHDEQLVLFKLKIYNLMNINFF